VRGQIFCGEFSPGELKPTDKIVISTGAQRIWRDPALAVVVARFGLIAAWPNRIPPEKRKECKSRTDNRKNQCGGLSTAHRDKDTMLRSR
jgi:hypothetical protein